MISTGAASGGTYALAAASSLAWNAQSPAIQTALQDVYGDGNVLVSPVGTTSNLYAAMFIGALWGQYVELMPFVDDTTGGSPGSNVTISLILLPNRIIRLMQHTCDIYAPASLSKFASGEVKDVAPDPTPIATGVPCYYKPTPNYSEPKGPGVTKLNNIMTADEWHFLVWQDIADRYTIVMQSPGHAYFGREWAVQGNAFVNQGVSGRPSLSQFVYGVLGPTRDIP